MKAYVACPGPKCKAVTFLSRAFCAGCWARLPGEIKDRLADAWYWDEDRDEYRPDPDVYARSIKTAVKWLEKA